MAEDQVQHKHHDGSPLTNEHLFHSGRQIRIPQDNLRHTQQKSRHHTQRKPSRKLVVEQASSHITKQRVS